MTIASTYTAFLRDHRLARGPLAQVVRDLGDRPEGRRAQVFDDRTGELVKLGRPAEVERALAIPPTPPTAPQSLTVTLLPRHVAWLEAQPGGPSAALRRLIDAARQEGVGRERQARDAA